MTTKRVRPNKVQVGDFLQRSYLGVMRVSRIYIDGEMVHFYDSQGSLWCHKVSGWATIVDKDGK